MGRLTIHEIEKTASELMYYKDKLANGIFGDKIGCFDKAMEALKELQKYKDLEEQGRLIELPCDVGDTVWCISEKKIHKAIARKVTGVTGLNNYRLVKIEAEFEIEDPFYCDGRMMKMGTYGNYLENVFLTKEEAEAKLKELKGE